MTENCYDIGTIQAFLDGELAAEQSETVARHVSVCDDCAILLATAEEETAFAFTALEPELNTLVPTQRLWTKINDSIEREKQPFWKPIFAFLLRPSTAAFASLAFVAVVSLTLLSLKPDAPSSEVARTNVSEKPVVNQIAQTNEVPPVNENAPVKPTERKIETINYAPAKNEVRAVKTAYVRKEAVSANVKSTVTESEIVNPPVPRENVLGEDSYVKTIATLTATVNNRKDEVLSPSARFAFERDMAVTDDAIKQMRKEVQKNPSNEAAKQVLRTSYQNKIDLLSSVADKTELMASLK